MDLVRRRRLGMLAWVAGAAVAIAAGVFRSTTLTARGVGYAPPVLVAPLEPGRLKELNVELHSTVHAGDVLATIDPALLQAERQMAEAALLATREQLQIEEATVTRRFAETAEGSKLALAQLEASLAEDRALVRTLRERLTAEQKLLEQGVSSGLVVDDIRWQLEIAQARVQGTREALGVAGQVAETSQQRQAVAPVANPWEVVAAVRTVDWLDRRLEQYTLTADIDGLVTAIYAGPGSMVSEGVPVLELRSHATRQVVAYVDERRASELEPGEDALVVRASGESLAGRLLSVGPAPQTLPLSLWPHPNDPRLAVPVRVELVQGEVAPDETVTVRL